MRMLFLLSSIGFFTPLVSAGEPSLSAVEKEAVQLFQDYIKTLGTIKDTKTAKTAIAPLDMLAARHQAFRKKFRKLPFGERLTLLLRPAFKKPYQGYKMELLRIALKREVLATLRPTKMIDEFREIEKRLERERIYTNAIKKQLEKLRVAVERFRLDHDFYPQSLYQLPELNAAGKGPYLKKTDLENPWGLPFRYDPSGQRNKWRAVDIWTLSPLGQTFGNWTLPESKQVKNLRKQQVEKRNQQLATARARALLLTKAAQAYRRDHGKFPKTLGDLAEKQRNGKGPYIKKQLLVDPWGNRYSYNASGPRNQGKMPDVWTVEPRTAWLIGNWTEKQKTESSFGNLP